MSDFRIFVGDQEMPLDATSMELDINHDVNLGIRQMVEYGRTLPSASASFEMTDPAFELVKDWALGDRRMVTLTNEWPLNWSRWRRWLNAVLRFAWWPLGPPPLPTTAEAAVTFPEMEITRISKSPGEALSVDMSTHPVALPDPEDARDGG